MYRCEITGVCSPANQPEQCIVQERDRVYPSGKVGREIAKETRVCAEVMRLWESQKRLPTETEIEEIKRKYTKNKHLEVR